MTQDDQRNSSGQNKAGTEWMKDSGYTSQQSKQSSVKVGRHGNDKQVGRKNYPEQQYHSSSDRSVQHHLKGNAAGNASKSAEKLGMQARIEDSSLTSTSQCSTENSDRNGKSTEADVESCQDDIPQQGTTPSMYPQDQGSAVQRYHEYRRLRQNKSFEHYREYSIQEAVNNRSLPVHLEAVTEAGAQHVCNVSAGSASSSKSDHVLQWLQQNARQGILNAAPPPTPATPGCTAVPFQGGTVGANRCSCPTCRPPVNPQEMSTKLLAVLQHGSAMSSAFNQSQPSPTCPNQGANITNPEGHGILALLRPQDIQCGVHPNQSTCSCQALHSSVNTSGGALPNQQYLSPQRNITANQCQANPHSMCVNHSPMHHAAMAMAIQHNAASACGGGSPCGATSICGALSNPALNICGSPLRHQGVCGSPLRSQGVCSSPLQQARAPGLDDSMFSSISAIHLYQSPDKMSGINIKGKGALLKGIVYVK